MSRIPDAPHSPAGPVRGLDMLAVGRAVFGEPALPAPPVVEGFSKIEWLAEGGFGTVWQAVRDGDGVKVALKIPHRADAETAERIEAEADSLRGLDHPHIVYLHDVAADAHGTPVLVMEFVDGMSVTARLPHHGFDFDHALQIFLPVLDAVVHAHARGVLHRDLKPSNILLSGEGIAKVTDFGLAQPLKDQRVNFSLTKSGALAGTVEYLAPERYDPDTKEGTASDIYALGIVLYEMLTGRPPRGAWQAPSEIKRLDVRLDELILEAIHPDPAKRLPSAGVFHKRLQEIRDSRPRFCGVPLVTRTVRTADALWTVAGLYSLAAGFCSLLSMNNTNVPGIFDLTFGHTKLLGGYWALWVLSLTMGFVWGWQAVRLWRFRNIPFREALPSPFGLRIGHSRSAAVLVGMAQFACAWAPLVYAGWIYSQCWYWATPDTAPWERVLAVTRWGSEVPVSQWTWQPRGMWNADEFWIREMQPPPVHGKAILHDRQSFFIVTQPLVMLLGTVSTGVGILTTGIALCIEWGRRRRSGLLVTALIAYGLVFAVSAAVSSESRDRARRHILEEAGLDELNLVKERVLYPRLSDFFNAVYGAGAPLPERFARMLAPEIKTRKGLSVSRDEFLRILSDDCRRHPRQFRHVEACRLKYQPKDGEKDFAVMIMARIYDAPPNQPVTGKFVKVSLHSLRTSPDAEGFLVGWNETEIPLYSAEDRSLTPAEAGVWQGSLLQALNDGDRVGLDQLLLPVMMEYDFDRAGEFPVCPPEYQTAPAPREALTAVLHSAMQNRSGTTFTATTPPLLTRLPGARWKLDSRVVQSGLRSGGLTSTRELEWQIELVFVGGRWQCLRLHM